MTEFTRDYFRINTEMQVAWALITGDCSGESPLGAIDTQLQSAITNLKMRDAEGARVLGLLSQKIDAIYSELSGSGSGRHQMKVNISGSGIAFDIDQEVEEGARVSLALELPDIQITVRLKAHVVGCLRRSSGSGLWRLRCRYESGQDMATEQIVAFVNRLQLADLSQRGETIADL